MARRKLVPTVQPKQIGWKIGVRALLRDGGWGSLGFRV